VKLPVLVDGLTREQRRSRRKRDVRKHTESMKRLTKTELQLGAMLYPEDPTPLRPLLRAECVDGYRPCPFAGCRWNLYLDVQPRTGAITYNFPDIDPSELVESCALDVADRGGETLEAVGAIVNLTRERIRQVEVKALAKLEHRSGVKLRELAGDGPDGRRRLPILEGIDNGEPKQ
jgi:hypothetical protein